MVKIIPIKKLVLILVVVFSSCTGKKSDEPVAEEPIADTIRGIEERAENLSQQGFGTFISKEGDSTYLMQRYYMVFLKKGENRDQDSAEVVNLQRQHLEHLSRMAAEGYASLMGPFGDDGEIRGVVVYQTPTEKMADSLARLDPMVKAGRLEVEIHPWWTQKGGSLR